VGDPPRWPESTRHISELRVTIELRAGRHGQAGDVDGPPPCRHRRLSRRWLLDLALIDQSYEDWSREAIALAEEPTRSAVSAHWRQHRAELDPGAAQDEQVALESARIFTASSPPRARPSRLSRRSVQGGSCCRVIWPARRC